MLIFDKIFFSTRKFEFLGTWLSLDEYLSSTDTDSKKKLRSAFCGAGQWRRVAIYSSPLCTVRASRRVKCLDKRAVHVSWSSPPHAEHQRPSFVIRAYVIAHVFSRRMATRDVWIPEFWFCIPSASAVFASPIMYVTNFTVPYLQKSFQTRYGTSVSVMVTSNNIKQSADWASLKLPWQQPCKGFKFHGCIREREIADKRYNGLAAALGSVCESQHRHTTYLLH